MLSRRKVLSSNELLVRLCDVELVGVRLILDVVHALFQRARHIIQRVGIKVDNFDIDRFIAFISSFVVVG